MNTEEKEKEFDPSEVDESLHGVKSDRSTSSNDEKLDKIEDDLLEGDKAKRKKDMPVSGRSVFDIQKKKDDNEHNRH